MLVKMMQIKISCRANLLTKMLLFFILSNVGYTLLKFYYQSLCYLVLSFYKLFKIGILDLLHN